jgi:lambda family phage portal protein
MTFWDRIVSWFSPEAGLRRIQARAAVEVFTKRHYEAAQTGSHRTSGWNRSRADINAVTRAAGAELRTQARDLIRNNSWAKRGQRTIANNTVGWGIVPKPNGPDPKVNAELARLWKLWADSTDCESEGRHTFYGIQAQVMKSVPSDGDFMIRRRWRKPDDVGTSGAKLPVPMQLQLLEADFLDATKDGEQGVAGGPIIQGVEFDKLGRRAAYWIFPQHPGSSGTSLIPTAGNLSYRVPASEIIHVLDTERPGQARGISWFGSAIVPLRDFNDFEDAELMRAKIAACFAAFVTDRDGSGAALGEENEDDSTIDQLEPGMIKTLKDGQEVTFGTPPVTANDSFAARQLRRVAAGLGVTYEDLVGDYSNVNFSSARMGRIAHQGNVKHWQHNMLIPLLCAGVWRWFCEAVIAMPESKITEPVGADWTVPPLPMIEPEKEGLAYSRLVRNGTMTWSEMIREQGGDPDAHFAEYAADKKRIDELGLMLDSDPEKTSQAGLTQARAGVGDAPPGGDKPVADPKEKPKRDEDPDLLTRIREFRRSLV